MEECLTGILGSLCVEGCLADIDTAAQDERCGRIVLDAVEESLEIPFSVTLSGNGSSSIGLFSILDNVGTIEINGRTHGILIYETSPWDEFDLIWYQGLVFAADRWYWIVFYCSDESVDTIWYAGTDCTPLQWEEATGTCDFEGAPVTVQAKFPATDMPVAQSVTGYSFVGPDISLNETGRGFVVLDGIEMKLMVFEDADCTSGKCGSSSWYEMHAVLWDELAPRACFAIFYFFPERGNIEMYYSLCLPDLATPLENAQFEASCAKPNVGEDSGTQD